MLGKTTPHTRTPHTASSGKSSVSWVSRPVLPSWASRKLCDFELTACPLFFNFLTSKTGRLIPQS